MYNTHPIVVVIVDDCELIRFSLKTILARLPYAEVKFEASNGQELLESLKLTDRLPDVVLLDIGMPIMNGYETLHKLKKEWPQINAIVLSQNCAEYSIRYMLQHGASAFLSKKNALCSILNVIKEVTELGYSYSDVVPKDMFEKIIRKREPIPELSSQQKKVFQLIYEGLCNKEIAAKLNVGTSSVESYRKEIGRKLDLKIRAEFMLFAVRTEYFT